MIYSETIHTLVLSSSHPQLAKRISMARVVISFFMLLGGILSILMTFTVEDKSSSLSMALMVFGTILLLWAIFRFFWKGQQLVYLPTQSRAYEKNFYFDLRHLADLQELLVTGFAMESKDFTSDSNGNVRMDVLYSEDCAFAAVQLFQFVPYNYQPVSAIHYFSADEVVRLMSFLQVKKDS